MKVKNGGGLAQDGHIGNIWKWTHSECFRGDNDSTGLLIGLGKVIPRFFSRSKWRDGATGKTGDIACKV